MITCVFGKYCNDKDCLDHSFRNKWHLPKRIMGIEHENNVGIRPTLHIDQRILGRVVNNAGPGPV